MEVIEAIRSRRSIRVFRSTPVDEKIIKDILNCGRFAPSAKNRQPWRFSVLRGKSKEVIADLMIDYTRHNDKTKDRNYIGYNSTVKYTANVIKQAPILILIFREKNDNWIYGDNLSIGACAENMCLRAKDLGLGSLWILDIIYVGEEICKMFNYWNLELNCTLLLGFSEEEPKPRKRKSLSEITRWYS